MAGAKLLKTLTLFQVVVMGLAYLTPMAVFDILRRMGPIRQVEAAELMAGQNNYSVQFAKALLAATPDAALAVPRRKPPKREGQVSTEQMAKMERELASLSQPNLPGAPDPIRVARADVGGDIPAMVSPLTGKLAPCRPAPPISTSASPPHRAARYRTSPTDPAGKTRLSRPTYRRNRA